MSSQPQPSTTGAPHPEDTQHHRDILNEVIDMGAGLARMVHQQAVEANHASPAAIESFERIARTIRRTILLARKLAEPVASRTETRKQIIRAVEDAIQREARSPEADALRQEFHERLDRPDLEDEIGSRPVAAIIADICRDLGLGAMPGSRPWKRRTPQDLAELCARAAKPGLLRDSPLRPLSVHEPPPARRRQL